MNAWKPGDIVTGSSYSDYKGGLPGADADLYGRLVVALYAVPHADRKNHHWVMDRDWYDKCAIAADWPKGRHAETMFGLPMRVRDGAGFPHLVPGVIGTSADADTLERAADIIARFSSKPRSFTTLVLCKTLRNMAAKVRP